jgi:hypothetical protein
MFVAANWNNHLGEDSEENPKSAILACFRIQGGCFEKCMTEKERELAN